MDEPIYVGEQAAMKFFNITLAGGLLAALILTTPSTPLPPSHKTELKTTRPAKAVAPQTLLVPQFQDHTLDAGITFSHLQGDKQLTGLNEVMGAGACAFDYDDDGWVDPFSCQWHRANPLLWRSALVAPATGTCAISQSWRQTL